MYLYIGNLNIYLVILAFEFLFPFVLPFVVVDVGVVVVVGTLILPWFSISVSHGLCTV